MNTKEFYSKALLASLPIAAGITPRCETAPANVLPIAFIEVFKGTGQRDE
jgi:hypothetical protein